MSDPQPTPSAPDGPPVAGGNVVSESKPKQPDATPAHGKVTSSPDEVWEDETKRTSPVAETDPVPERREKVRGSLAIGLLSLVAAIAILTVSFVIRSGTSSDMVGVVDKVLPPLVTLLGTVTGFYFGAATASKPQGGNGER